MHSTPTPAPSRRELNRLATRHAIASAVLRLAETEDFSSITVERAAELAGVSRRTFFNYFRSLEDALHEPLRELVARTAARMESQDPVGSDILTLLAHTLDEVLTLELLDPTARVLLITRDNPELREAGLKTWDDCVRSLIPPVGEGTPALRLYISTLVRASVAVAQAAFENWAETLSSPVDEAEVKRLRGILAQGLALAGNSFALPDWLDEADLASCPPIPSLDAAETAPSSPTAPSTDAAGA